MGGVLVLGSIVWAASRNFVADVTFTGSSLKGWHSVGSADWRAENGEIIGNARPGTSGGWLVLDQHYQDVQFFASFRCTGACKAGLLFRQERTADGGSRGIYVSLAPSEAATYRMVLDDRGNEVTREKLRPIPQQIGRIAPPLSQQNRPTVAGAEDGPNLERPAFYRPGQVPPTQPGERKPVSMPGGIPAPVMRQDTSLRLGEWNSIEVALDANVVRVFLNGDVTGISGGGGVADEVFGRYGPFALYAGDVTEVRFKDVSYKDLQTRVTEPEKLSSHFGMQRISDFYYSWGPDVADINRDGIPDIVAGPYYYLGPEHKVAKQIYVGETLNPSTQFFVGNQFAYDFTGDGWPDVLNALLGSAAVLYVNPRGESRRWDEFAVTEPIRIETTLLKDIDGDGKREFVFKNDDTLMYAKPDPANPTGMWITHRISERGPWASHGLGVGDINGDGALDVLNPYGWWEQPAKGAAREPWIYHPQSFCRWIGSAAPGGAEMAVYDVNGDGLNDVVTSLQAHYWGLAWYEQKRSPDGRISFQQHMIMDDLTTKNAGGVTFSELHGATFADIDGDGIPDFITGKRVWSHRENYSGPDPYGAPVLYVYRTVRNPQSPGGAEFVPELIHNRSGVGNAPAVADLNKDGALEIITSDRRGTFIFWNNWKKPRVSNGRTAR
jgi:hypothetical protein